MLKRGEKISVIVPCYNEESVIVESYQRINSVLTKNDFDRYEILFIDDGSTDRTPDLLWELSGDNKSVKVIRFSRNFGHQAAVTAGIQYSSGDLAVILDADLQDPPELIPDMVRMAVSEKANVVYGVRKERDGEGFLKLLTAKLYYRIMNHLSEVPLPLDTGDFRLIDKKVIKEFKKLKEKRKYVRGLISWIGFRQIPLYYSRAPRFAGKTKYSAKKMIGFAATGLLYFTKKPLRLALSLGFFSVLVGVLLTIYVFVSKYLNANAAVPGWASTLIVIIFFGGVQLVTVGVMGEYIGGIFDEVKERPEFIIDEKVNLDEEP